ncbi:MAG: type IX secretion system sortase PorU [Chitinophagales bacterium]
MMSRVILLFISIFSLGFSRGQVYNLRIEWNMQVNFEGSNLYIESFKEAVFQKENGVLPTYNVWLNLPGDGAEPSFTNLIFEELQNSNISKQGIKENIEFTAAVGMQRKESSLLISCVPLRVNPFTGKIEKLVAFDVQLNPSYQASFKAQKSYKPSSALASGLWHKIAVPADGIYKIDFDFLQNNNISSSNLSFSNFGVFGQAMGLLPEANSEDRVDDIEEIPIKIKDQNGNGIWENGDYILFYGKGPHLWHYDQANNTWQHEVNIYTDETGYFISPTQGTGKQIPLVASAGSANANINSYTFRDFFEEELNNLIYTQLSSTMGSGKEWYGKRLSNVNNTQSFNIAIPNILSSSASVLNLRLAASSYASSSNFTLRNNGSNIFTSSVNITSGGDYPNAASANMASFSSVLSSNNNFELVFSNGDPQSSGFLDYLEVVANCNLALQENFLLFRSTQNLGVGNISSFNLTGANTNTEIWDVSSGTEVFRINGNLSGSSYQFSATTDKLREFAAVNTSSTSFAQPRYISSITNQNLHALSQNEMFIISHPSLLPAADRLANFHREEGMRVAVVNLDHIYNEFSSGQQDLSAIRDFLKMFYERANNPADLPKYALLFGDASFDYKDRVDGNENLVPTFQSQESFSLTSSYCTDDYIAFLDPNEGSDLTNVSNPNNMDLSVGRIPVDNLEEAQGVVDKILAYNTSTTMQDWRNILSFVADDEDNNLHFGPVEQLSALSTIDNIDFYNIDKIYLDAYTQSNSAGGDRYPDVNDAILRKIRTGSFLINYTGHGGPKNWAQERVFNIEDIRNLDNIEHLPLFITATCDFSPYDDPDFHSAGENLITNAKGGAIALITTTRLVYAHQNFDMNSRVLDYLFQLYEGRMPTIGEVLYEAKNSASVSENNRKFVLLGDPALTLAYPVHEVITTKINGVDISQIDTLKALSKVLIEGEVRTRSGALLNNFNGVIYPSVYDKVATYSTKGQDEESQVAEFQLQNNILFKGKASVVAGKFSFEFIVPKDINYAYDNGKISYYAASNFGLEDAHGYSYNFLVGGTADSIVNDDLGPLVDVFINDTSFAFGGLSDENPILLVKLSDESGINTVGNGVGHDIVGLLNENTQKQYLLNDYYSAKLDDFTRGDVEFPFNKLEDGRYTIRVKAWDVYNNPGEGYTEFVVASSAELALQHVFNYPNPFTTNTSFIFEHNRPGEFLDVSVQIFTISGKLVKTIRTNVQSEAYRVGPSEITWDGLDDFGDMIGRGVYIYKLKVQAESGYSAQEFEKLVILR